LPYEPFVKLGFLKLNKIILGPGDKVKCFHCGGNLTGWEFEDDPWEQHRVWYGTCSYLRTHQPAPRRQTQEMPQQQVSIIEEDKLFLPILATGNLRLLLCSVLLRRNIPPETL